MSNTSNGPKWTDAQKTAIETEGCQLLVAAGAGSGKTSVLTQRILEKIKRGKDIKDFIVVTFTVSSAEDMKEKLRQKLLAEYSKDTSNKFLSNQIAKLPFAQISTITSFCFNLVKQNFTSLGLSSSLRIADESEAEELFKTATDILFDEKFQENSEDLLDILSLSACRGEEKKLENYLNTLYNKKIRAHPNYKKTLSEVSKTISECAQCCETLDKLLDSPLGNIFKNGMDYLFFTYKKDISDLLEIASSYGGVLYDRTQEYVSFILKAEEFAQKGDFSGCIQSYSSIGTVSWTKGKPYSDVDPLELEYFKEIKSTVKEKTEKASEFFSKLVDFGFEDTLLSVKLCKAYANLLIRLDEIYEEVKREKGVLDFTDAEQFAHALLIDENGHPTELCLEIAASTHEVLVDEYQDTNPLQDSIFSALSTKDNRFMVGDDKQSIYRFRNAYPDIFNRYKKAFVTEKAKCIFLRENFRCSKEIIDFTNDVFSFLWGDSYENEKLIFAKTSEEKAALNKHPVVVKTFITPSEPKKPSVHESKYICNEIKRLVGSYVKENGEVLKYSDVAILLPVMKNVGHIFIEELKKHNIPVSVKKEGSLISMPEVKFFISVLKAINNPEEDIPLASAMNSFFFGFSGNDLAEIRKYKTSSLWGSVIECANKDEIKKGLRIIKITKTKKEATHLPIFLKSKNKLKRKCRIFISKLNKLREKARSIECKKLIWELLENEGILSSISTLPKGEEKKGNLLLFYTLAIEFGRREYKTLSAFLKYAENLTVSSFMEGEQNAVSLMTIHGSKGLEFPLCFIANAGKPLGRGGSGEKQPLYNPVYGVLSPIKTSSLSTRTPALYSAAELSEKPEEIAEEKRRLYVALTRARELLYIVGTSAEKYSLRNANPDEAKNYLNWILTSHPQCIYDDEKLGELKSETSEELSEQENQNDINLTEVKEEVQNPQDFFVEDEEEPFIYPFENAVNIPRKLSVSQLKEKENKEYTQTVRKQDFLTVPTFATETKKVSGAEVGIANHTFMQFASFENCQNFGVEAEAERLLLTNMLTDEQYGMLNFKSLKEFFLSDLFKKISSSKKVYREKRFTVSDSSKELFGAGDETVLVQGVIDIFFENSDGTYTVADYKTDKINKGEEHILIDRYKGQLSYYAKAVEEMTKKKVSDIIIYSFALGKEIKLNIDS